MKRFPVQRHSKFGQLLEPLLHVSKQSEWHLLLAPVLQASSCTMVSRLQVGWLAWVCTFSEEPAAALMRHSPSWQPAYLSSLL
jgi:hypothetical protein